MKLAYETEMSEKETSRLLIRCSRFLKELREISATMSVLWTVGALSYFFIICEGDGIRLAECLISILGTLVFLICFFIIDQFLVQRARRIYRQRKTHRVEYRLTDENLVFTAGETTFSSPWNKLAKKFRIDRNVLYLYGKDLPFEAQCIPDWQGRGVGKKELVAVLKKAGLKKTMNDWLKCLVVLVVQLVVLTIYFYIGGIEWGDWTIPNEAELRLELHDVPDAENAYLALQALTNLYHVTESDDASAEISDKTFVRYYGNPFFTDGDNDEWEKWATMRRDSSSPQRAARILAENVEFFENFRKALWLKSFANTDARLEDAKRIKEGKPPWLSYLPLYKPIIGFAQLVAFRAQVALERGDIESAASDIGEIHALGQLVMANNESLVAYLVGALIENYSYRKMCDAVALGKATDEVVERFNKMVAVSEANAPMAWERALKTEIAVNSEGVDWMCDHPAHALNALLFRSDVYDKDGNILSPSRLCRILSGWPGFAKFAFHRREMQYRIAMFGHALLADDDDLAEMISHEIPRILFLPNFLGNRLLSKMPDLCSLLNDVDRRARTDRLRPHLVLAAAKWRKAHGGENPPTLDALVPDYLVAVPRDPWSKSGEPIKYDAALGVAWSIGKDGKYDYRKIAKDHATGSNVSVDSDTQKYAFRLDGKPIGSLTEPIGTNDQPQTAK